MKKKSAPIYLYISLLFLPFFSQAQTDSPLGTWMAFDPDTGEPRSHIELFMKGEELKGKVVKLMTVAPDTKCAKCSGERKNQPLLGMEIISGLHKEEGKWVDGQIYRPINDKSYNCKVWVDPAQPDILYVRGYVGFIYSTQEWKRIK